MTFKCKRCKLEVCVTEEDAERYKERGFLCDFCFSVIVARKYPKKLFGKARTLFSPSSSALGDWIVESVVRERYKRDNPDEEIIYLGLSDADEAVRVYRPDKFFWSAITNFMKKPSRFKVIEFNPAVEATLLAEDGIYPVFDWSDAEAIETPSRYAVLSFRNVIKCGWKNAEPIIVNRVMLRLDRLIEEKKLSGAFIVGNDDPIEGEYLPGWATDLRKKIGVKEIARLCAGAAIFAGKDSGIPHLAAASGCRNMVLWGYREKIWIPKTAKERFTAFMKAESTGERIVAEIERRLELNPE